MNLVVLAMVAFFQLPSAEQSATTSETIFVDKVALKVNDKMVTERELFHMYKQRRAEYLRKYTGAQLDTKLNEAWQETVDDMEETLLLYEKAMELGIDYSEDNVRSQLNAWRESNGLNEEEFEEVIERETGMTVDAYVDHQRREYSATAAIQSQVISKIKIEDSEIAKFYDENKRDYLNPATYRIGEIVLLKGDKDLLAQRFKAQSAKKFLDEGGTFEEAAQQFSDSSSKRKGGDLGLVEWGDLNSTIEDAVKTLQVGQVSEILETEYAIFIVKLLENNVASPKPLQEVRDEIIERLRKPRLNSSVENFLERLRQEFLVQVYSKEVPSYLDM
jgi:parvulin-like peptidyl-prolyl isomerase